MFRQADLKQHGVRAQLKLGVAELQAESQAEAQTCKVCFDETINAALMQCGPHALTSLFRNRNHAPSVRSPSKESSKSSGVRLAKCSSCPCCSRPPPRVLAIPSPLHLRIIVHASLPLLGWLAVDVIEKPLNSFNTTTWSDSARTAQTIFVLGIHPKGLIT